MNDKDELVFEAEEASKPLTPLQLFMAKLAAVTGAAIVFLFVASMMLNSFIATNAEKFAFLKGGQAFWSAAELKLYALADGQDLPPEKKERIIRALTIINERYKPYLEAAGFASRAPRTP